MASLFALILWLYKLFVALPCDFFLWTCKLFVAALCIFLRWIYSKLNFARLHCK